MKKFLKKAIIISMTLIFVVFSTIIIISCNHFTYKKPDFNKIDLNGIDNIMIVAHPDDEIIWGGAHLLNDNYLVVCITHGNDKIRSKEFKKAMKITGDKYIMLNYPDKILNRRDEWKNDNADIKKDLTEILKLKKWKVIVTHNPKGEYGHIQHIKTSEIITDIYKNNFSQDNNLFYFGKYYSAKTIKNQKDMPEISDNNLKTKLDIIKNVYKSQVFIMDKFGQMVPYENWTQYKP